MRVSLFILIAIFFHYKRDNSFENRSNKISQIRQIVDSVGFVELPYLIKYDASIENSYKISCCSKDSSLYSDFSGGDLYIVGSLPDTTNYFGLIYVAVASSGIPHLLTYDKAGNRIDVSPLIEENSWLMAGEMLTSKEFIEIRKDLTMKYFFKSQVVYKVYEQNTISRDTVCTYYEKEGKIMKDGMINFKSRIKKPCK